MFATREDVIELLKTYPILQKKIRLLEYERLHPPKASQDEVISELALGHPLTSIVGSAGHISNKTMQIALNFQDETDRLNYETILEIDQELHTLISWRKSKLRLYANTILRKRRGLRYKKRCIYLHARSRNTGTMALTHSAQWGSTWARY